MKSYKCHIDLDLFRNTETGKRKVWRTDNEVTYCCCTTPTLFIWERATKFNEYNPYSGYIDAKHVELI